MSTVWSDPVPLRFDASLEGIEGRPGVYRIHSRRFGWYYIGSATGGPQYGGSLHKRLSHYRLGQHGGGLVEWIIEEMPYGGQLHEFLIAWRPESGTKKRRSTEFRRAAMKHLDLEVSVTYTEDGATARALETAEQVRMQAEGEWLINRQVLSKSSGDMKAAA